MSKFFGKSFWFCLAFIGNTLLVENIAIAAETTAGVSQIPDAINAITIANEVKQFDSEIDDVTNTLNSVSPIVIANEVNQSQPTVIEPEQNFPTQVESASKSQDANSMSQVTSVSQLSDVQPTDWAFQALQSLVERYGCIAGYPDGTFRGNRALTRYEFAAGLNACLDQITRLIGGATANFVTKEDLAILQRLQEEFAAELSTLRGRIDSLEARATELEANQFSTTTKLNGETIWAITDTFGDGAVDDDNTNTNFGYRVRLNFDTSFTGEDRLRTRLQARNMARLDRITGTPMTRTNFDGDDGSQIILDKLSYLFPLGNNTTVEIGAKGLTSDDVGPIINPYFAGSADGAVSRFGAFNPAIYNTPGETGIAINHRLGNKLNLTLSYLANTAADPTEGNGLFNGSYGALAQLTYSPTPQIDLALSYVRSYSRRNDVNLSLGTGSNNANEPFGQEATRGNHYGFEASWQLSPRFALASWVGYVDAKQLSGGDASAGIWNGAIAFAFPDLFKEGNLGGIIVGIPPKVTENDIKGNRDDATSLHVEALYRIQVSDFISVTPGVYVITNTDHNEDNGTTWVGVLRTSFTF
ncbi:iron uptake porin [Kamptonema sp. UHCC 0994]|uniref:iron uptake porin n=1 Tax=Kamptonema sp. UHCC 0994 TaxID=3031329 RepID=UPI0023B94F92|nr:iron uptake porin [Kamptonema sp. UHCC 0994]MDF0552061.1 iron uptake porin [Kamptonema sp. UHCC 0994]